jgi:hypothetical protein
VVDFIRLTLELLFDIMLLNENFNGLQAADLFGGGRKYHQADA